MVEAPKEAAAAMTQMTIALFGATGRTGRLVLQKLLDRQYAVKILVRDPAKLPSLPPSVTVIQGSVTDRDRVFATIAGCDAVITVIGHTKDTPPRMQELATGHIIAAMAQAHIRRIIALTGAGVFSPGDRPNWLDRALTFVLSIVAHHRLQDGIRFAAVLRASTLDWTLVRAPLLHNRPARGAFQVGLAGSPQLSFQLSRHDLADFIVAQLRDSQYIRQSPLVTW